MKKDYHLIGFYDKTATRCSQVSHYPWGSAGQSDSELFIHLTTDYSAGAVARTRPPVPPLEVNRQYRPPRLQ